MSASVRVLNFDQSVTQQHAFLSRFQPEIVDLTPLGPSARIWVSRATANAIRRVLHPGSRAAVTLIGSGDFHHVSSLLIEQFREPISVIVFDHHPDWDILPPKLHCGSWVTQVLKQPNVKHVILFGVSSNDLSSPRIHSGNLGSLTQDRLEIYPYRHEPTTVMLRRVPVNRSCRVVNHFGFSTITWTELSRQPLQEFVRGVLERLEVKQVYVSIDKDCLQAGASLTNWEAGFLSLDALLQMLRLMRQCTEVVGADLVGDYSPPKIRGWLKTMIAKFDYPNDYSARGKSADEICRVNEATNLKLVEFLTTTHPAA